MFRPENPTQLYAQPLYEQEYKKLEAKVQKAQELQKLLTNVKGSLYEVRERALQHIRLTQGYNHVYVIDDLEGTPDTVIEWYRSLPSTASRKEIEDGFLIQTLIPIVDVCHDAFEKLCVAPILILEAISEAKEIRPSSGYAVLRRLTYSKANGIVREAKSICSGIIQPTQDKIASFLSANRESRNNVDIWKLKEMIDRPKERKKFLRSNWEFLMGPGRNKDPQEFSAQLYEMVALSHMSWVVLLQDLHRDLDQAVQIVDTISKDG